MPAQHAFGANSDAERVAAGEQLHGTDARHPKGIVPDTVAADEVVAVVETNQSLVRLDVKAPIAGVIVDRDVNAGETVTDAATLYTIADLSDVWIDLNVPKRDHARVKIGQPVIINGGDDGEPAKGKIDWIAPTGSAEAQSSRPA